MSYVLPDLSFSHQLIVQESRAGVLSVGGKDIGRCTDLHQLIRHLLGVAGYMLDLPPCVLPAARMCFPLCVACPLARKCTAIACKNRIDKSARGSLAVA